jgi:hypothetical protein
MLDKQIFRGVLSLLNAKEKRPKLQCLRRFLSLSGLSKKDVFANFYGSFEPTKYNFFIVHKLIICVFGIYTIRLFCYNTQVYLVFHLYLFHHTNHDAR